jgi:hypothetical protein
LVELEIINIHGTGVEIMTLIFDLCFFFIKNHPSIDATHVISYLHLSLFRQVSVILGLAGHTSVVNKEFTLNCRKQYTRLYVFFKKKQSLAVNKQILSDCKTFETFCVALSVSFMHFNSFCFTICNLVSHPDDADHRHNSDLCNE